LLPLLLMLLLLLALLIADARRQAEGLACYADICRHAMMRCCHAASIRRLLRCHYFILLFTLRDD